MLEAQNAVLNWLANGETGISSETLAFWVMFNVKKAGGSHPRDPADFNRCLKLLDAAPALRQHLHKMSIVSPEWARLVFNWAEIEKVFIDEVGPDWSKGRRIPAEKTYNLMKAVIHGNSHAGSQSADESRSTL